MTTKSFALVDCNSFYCSCERIFRPDLNDKPIIVLSSNDGCAIARTTEAKKLNIKMGEPYFKIKNLCNQKNVHVFSSNFSLYTNISDRVMTTLVNNCATLEVYSIDEAFCDFTGFCNPLQKGHDLKKMIYKNIGIPVSVGIAPTKVLAKVANRIAKKSLKANGVVDLSSERFQDVALKMTDVADIWGIGRANALKLRELGIKTAYDFKVFGNDKLIKKIFTIVGLKIKNELKGESHFPLTVDVVKKKEIMCSRTFGGSVSCKDSLKESIANYVSIASEKMRKQNSLCMELSIFAQTNSYGDKPQHYLYEKVRLDNPTCDTRKLLKLSSSLVDKNFKYGFEYKKAGVKLSNFFDSNEYQMDFLMPFDTARDHALMRIIDSINFANGEGTIKFASCGTSDIAWRMNRNFKSPRYTTSWNELPIFK